MSMPSAITRENAGFLQGIGDLVIVTERNGGWYRDRTCDPYHVKVVLYR
jgi:hypothetical protein